MHQNKILSDKSANANGFVEMWNYQCLARYFKKVISYSY